MVKKNLVIYMDHRSDTQTHMVLGLVIRMKRLGFRYSVHLQMLLSLGFCIVTCCRKGNGNVISDFFSDCYCSC
jgi:hypothetical protein